MKNITIAGNIGRDAETRSLNSGDTVTGFSVAVEDRAGKEKKTLWWDCSFWGKRGESLAQYLTKGSKVTVSGDFGTREHDGKTYLTVRVNDVTLQGGSQRDDSQPRQQSGGGGGGYSSQSGFDDGLDDSVPFCTNSPAFDLARRVM